MTSHIHTPAAAALGAAISRRLPPAGPGTGSATDARRSQPGRARSFSPHLSLPIGIAFIGSSTCSCSRRTGKVQRVTGGALAGTVLDLAVNSASERGLLGDRAAPAVRRQRLRLSLLDGRADRRRHRGARRRAAARQRRPLPLERLGAHVGPQPDPPSRVPGGRRTAAAWQSQRSVIRFYPDGKLYIVIGDNGRRGQTEPRPTARSGRESTTTSSAARSRTTRIRPAPSCA